MSIRATETPDGEVRSRVVGWLGVPDQLDDAATISSKFSRTGNGGLHRPLRHDALNRRLVRCM